MTFLDKIKRGAKMFMFAPQKPKTIISQTSIYPKPKDLNENQIADMLEQKQQSQFQSKSQFQGQPIKDINRDKNGCYVSTITYPLPPLSWEQKQFDRNRRIRDGKNKYL